MIPRKFQKIVFSFFMALLMSGIISFSMSLVHVGIAKELIFIWLTSWPIAFIVAFPCIMLVSPIVNKLVALILEKEGN